jgi:hypothetical protein
MKRGRILLLALPLGAALAAGCFEGDAPTEQIGGTQFGMLLNVVSPTRIPVAQVRTFARAAAPTVLDSMTVSFVNLKPLTAPAVYRFWAVGAGAGDTVPVTAVLSRIRNDSVVNQTTGVPAVARTVTALGTASSFSGTFNNDTVVARFTGAQFGGTSRRFFVVTIETDPAATTFTSATPRPLWFAYRATAGGNVIVTPAAGTAALFGTFDVVAPRPFAGTGRGRSAFWDIRNDGHLEYRAVVEQITQPPRGYYYQGWLRDTRSRRAFRMSDMVDNAGNSLRDADELVIPGTAAQLPVGRFGITEAQAGGQPLSSFDGVHLILEPKRGIDTTHALTTVLQGIMGDTLGLRGLGAIEVTALRNGQPVPGVGIVVVPDGATAGVGQPRPASTGSSGATNGKVVIGAIPAGPVQLFVQAPTGMTPTTPPAVTVLPRDTVAVTITLQ